MKKRIIYLMVSIVFISTTVFAYSPNAKPAQAQGVYCQLGATRTKTLPAHVKVGNFTTRTREKSAIYQPDPGWTPYNYQVKTISKYGITGMSTIDIQANSRYISTNELKETHNQLVEHFGQFKYREYEGKAKAYYNNRMNSYYSSVNQYASSHRAIQVKISASGHGSLSDKTSAISIELIVYEVCIGQPNQVQHFELVKNETLTHIMPYGVVCLINKTNLNISYSYRWGDQEWKSDSIKPGHRSWYWWNYAKGNPGSPKFHIAFDNNTASGYQGKEYWLKRQAAPEHTCDRAYRYNFSHVNGNKTLVDIYED